MHAILWSGLNKTMKNMAEVYCLCEQYQHQIVSNGFKESHDFRWFGFFLLDIQHLHHKSCWDIWCDFHLLDHKLASKNILNEFDSFW